MNARELTLELLSWPSVTGSDGERAFGLRLHALLAAWPYFADHPEDLWLEDAGDGRFSVCALVRGSGSRGVVLAGHYDVVGIDDYGSLAELSGDPEALRAPLREHLAARGHPADLAAADDLASAEWLPGRGALDMKSGVAACLTTLASHAAWEDREGSVLLVVCPDEEEHSAGARAAAPAMRRLGLDVVLGINADVVTDEGNGDYARAVFCGGVGKVLLCALVRGRPAHVGDALGGLSAHALAAEVVRRVEGRTDWAGARVDLETLPPPVLLAAGDTKPVYDVTMPRDVLLLFNLLHYELAPEAALAHFRRVVAEALETACAAWPGRELPGPVHIVDGDVAPSDRDPFASARTAMTAEADDAGLGGPGAVVALGSVRYRPVGVFDPALIDRLTPVVEAAGVRMAGPYPNPSDLSFLADGTDHATWVNAGPWGRDFHRVTERVHTPYAFDVLPKMLGDLVVCALR